MTPAEEALRAAVARRGPVPFDEVVELALYHPDGGFYATDGRAGRHGDFLTSPEVGPLFGTVVARAIDGWWDGAGRPPVFAVVEAGAGSGSLAAAVLAAEPRCGDALRYVLVERSAPQRALHAEPLPLEALAVAFARLDEPDHDGPVTQPRPPRGPIAVSLAELPRLHAPCTLLVTELLDNLPFALLQRTRSGWSEVHVGLDGEALVEVLVPTGAGAWPDAAKGSRVPQARGAAAWVRDAQALAGSGGWVVAVDYASTTAELATRPWTEWVRTYRRHARGGPPLHALGTQDITCEVAIDQLPEPSRIQTQADWLRDHGIGELVADARRRWRERAAVGDLEAMRARSRVTEAEALLDPAGLGAFKVLEWTP